MGIVEWVVDALLDHDLDSVVALMRELGRAWVHDLIFLEYRSDFRSSEEWSPEKRQAIVDEHAEEISRRIAYRDDVTRRRIERLHEFVTTSFHGDRAFVYLAAGVIVQDGQFAGNYEEILVGHGPYLLAASTIPWTFDLPDLAAAVERANEFMHVRGQRSGRWRQLEQQNPQLPAACGVGAPSDVWEIVARLQAVSVAARMHFFDVLWYSINAKRPRALADCTLYRTRVFGCYTPDTSEELVRSGLVLRDCQVEFLNRWFRRNELRGMLEATGTTVKKSARLPELFEMAATSIPSKLVKAATEGDFFRLPLDISEVADELVNLYECQALRISAWYVGAWVPALRPSSILDNPA